MSLKQSRRVMLIGSGLGLAVLAAIVVALSILQPSPPRKVVMSTGPDGSAYAKFGERYREILARDGIELELRPSDGANENLTRLTGPASDVMIGLLSGGLTSAEKSPSLASLGTLAYEPLWMFHRHAGLQGAAAIGRLKGRKWAIGTPGSRTRTAAAVLLQLLGVPDDFAQFLSLPPLEAGRQLLAGEIDALMLVEPAETELIRSLLSEPDIELMHFRRADAYTSLYPFLTKLIVPEGVGNLALNRPPQDVALVAFETSLVVRKDLHPAIQMLLLNAAFEVHGTAGMFHKAGRFPAAEAGDLPISKSAAQYYRSGQPFLQRYLPFWLAVFVVQLLVAAIPVVGILYPALRLLPTAYGWTMRRRIYRLYGELKFLEQHLEGPLADSQAEEIRLQMEHLENRILHLRVPTTYSHLLYTLRQHLALVRSRLDASHVTQSSGRRILRESR